MTVRWGMLSTSSIGRVAAPAIRASASLVAVGGRSASRAAEYAGSLGIPRSYGSYDEVLADDEVDAVYVPLPVALHAEWTIRALRAGKHVLCEKPLAMTAADAAACFDAAEAAGRLCMEGLMWRHHPQTVLAQQLVRRRAIGRLALIRAALTVDVPGGNIRRTGNMGGGALFDLGCYCVSAIRLFGGEPERVAAAQVLDGPGGVDLRMAATLTLPGDVLAQFDIALDYPRRDELELVGTEGKLTIPDPWLCRHAYVELERDGVVERMTAEPADAYALEFALASAAFDGGAPPVFGRADAIAQAAALEAVRLGVVA